MIEIYFDDILIDRDSYIQLDNDYHLFTESFKLGSVASNTFKLSVLKSVVSSHPTNIRIEDGNTTYYLTSEGTPEEDSNFYTYTLTDRMVDLDFYYDASVIIAEKEALSEECHLSDILADICTKASITLDTTFTWLNDPVISVYDDSIKAREYVSYIGELQAGFNCIRDNKLTIKQHNMTSIKTINIDDCSDFILGERKVITRVVYDNGAVHWEYGNETGATLYLNTNNVYITNETIVQNIYNAINGFEFYSINVPKAPIDSTVKAGDVITFTDGTNSYKTIAQYSLSYAGQWVGGYSLQVNTIKQDETKIDGIGNKVKKLTSSVNQANAELNILSQKIDTNTTDIAELDISTVGISTAVAEVNTNLTNNYKTAEQVQALIDGNTQDIADVKLNYTSLDQTAKDLQVQITSINNNGVSKIVNTLFVLDENALNMSKTGEEMSAIYGYFTVDSETRMGLQVNRNNDVEILGVDNTGVRAENVTVRKYLVEGTYSRVEDYLDGTGVFCI